MPVVSLATLKSYFLNGKVPNEDHYVDLVDTLASGILDKELDLKYITDPGTPPSGYGRIHANSDNLLFKDDGGLRTILSYLGCQAWYSSAQTIGTGTWTSIQFTTELFDIGGFHDNSSNNTRFTVPLAGIYLMTVSATFTANATGWRGLRMIRNGSANDIVSTIIIPVNSNSFSLQLNISGQRQLSLNDYIEAQVYQSSGGDLDILALSTVAKAFTISRLG